MAEEKTLPYTAIEDASTSSMLSGRLFSQKKANKQIGILKVDHASQIDGDVKINDTVSMFRLSS